MYNVSYLTEIGSFDQIKQCTLSYLSLLHKIPKFPPKGYKQQHCNQNSYLEVQMNGSEADISLVDNN